MSLARMLLLLVNLVVYALAFISHDRIRSSEMAFESGQLTPVGE